MQANRESFFLDLSYGILMQQLLPEMKVAIMKYVHTVVPVGRQQAEPASGLHTICTFCTPRSANADPDTATLPIPQPFITTSAHSHPLAPAPAPPPWRGLAHTALVHRRRLAQRALTLCFVSSCPCAAHALLFVHLPHGAGWRTWC